MCDHVNVIEDDIVSDLICTDCGLVLDRTYQTSRECHIAENYNEDIRISLSNICNNAQINEGVVNDAMRIYQRIVQELSTSKFRRDDIIAFSLYEAVLRNEIGMSPHEVASHCNVCPKKLHTIEKILYKKSVYDPPTAYVERFAYFLNLEFSATSIIKGILLNMYGMGGVRPQNLAAAVIYLYCSQNNLKKTLREVCEVCNVSATSVGKIVSDLRRDFREDITKLYS